MFKKLHRGFFLKKKKSRKKSIRPLKKFLRNSPTKTYKRWNQGKGLLEKEELRKKEKELDKREKKLDKREKKLDKREKKLDENIEDFRYQKRMQRRQLPPIIAYRVAPPSDNS